jgi:hypothetical protein
MSVLLGVLKKLQDKVWGKDEALAKAAGNSIMSKGMTYTEYLEGLAHTDPTPPQADAAPKKRKTPTKPRVSKKSANNSTGL